MQATPLKQAKLDALWKQIQEALNDSQWEQAEGMLRRFLQIVPQTTVEVWDVLAYALLMQGDYSACLKVLKPWESDPSRSFWVNHKLGDAYRGLNQLEEAVVAYQRSLVDGSDTPLTVRNLLQVMDAQSPQRAIQQLRQWQQAGQLEAFMRKGAQQAASLVPGLELADALFNTGEADGECRRRLLEAACYALDWQRCADLLEASKTSKHGLTSWEQQLNQRLDQLSVLPLAAESSEQGAGEQQQRFSRH